MADKGKKKRVKCSSSSTIRSLKRRCFMSGLGINDRFNDDMLLQILCHLPVRSVIACKLVCKRWLSLISSQGFVSCFISRHHCHHQQRNYLVLKALGSYYFHLSSKLSNPDISFSFLPSTVSSFGILASSDDLLLCSKMEELDGNTIYFICNPFTKGSVELPPPPPSTSDHSFGFTCEPYYKVNDDREAVIVNSSCRFRVVRFKLVEVLIKEPPFMIEVDIFTSETWEWTTTVMHYPFRSQPTSSTSCNGLLYWMCYRGGVVVHDPYNNKVCYAIDPPQDGSSRKRFFYRVSSEGSLLAFRPSRIWNFKVWELVDLDQPEWRMKSAVAVREHLLNNSERFKCAWKSSLFPLAFHPNDKNVIFILSLVGGIASINLMTRVFKRRRLSPIIHSATISQHSEIIPIIHYEIKATCWPTPISALLNQTLVEKKPTTD